MYEGVCASVSGTLLLVSELRGATGRLCPVLRAAEPAELACPGVRGAVPTNHCSAPSDLPHTAHLRWSPMAGMMVPDTAVA